MAEINFEAFVKIIKEDIKVHIALLVISGIIVFTKDKMIKRFIGIQLPPYIKLFFFLVFITAFVVSILDLLEHFYKKNKKKREEKAKEEDQKAEKEKQVEEELNKIFEDPNLGNKIDLLYDWDRTYKENNLIEYARQLELSMNNRSEKFIETHELRREFASYFDIAYKYREKKLISDNKLKEIIGKSHVRALLEVVEPFDALIGENRDHDKPIYEKDMFGYFKDLYDL